jgi:prepilin-type N-terminal cleavage/methylation domain-containing protein
MKIQNEPRVSRGFTLIEMVGVLAVIAVLAALLIPRIFAAINESRLNNAAVSFNTIKSAAMMYFGKYGKFAGVNGAAITAPVNDWDTTTLLKEGLIEKPFAVRIGATASVRVVAGATAATDPTAANAAYELSGAGTAGTLNEAAPAQYVVQSVITGVTAQDAWDLNRRIDGEASALGAAVGAADLKGRVKFAAPDTAGVTDVYIYIAHK